MIKHKKRSITKKTLIYTGGSILASLSMAGSTYLYSKYTSTSDYGNFQLTISIMMLLATVGFLDIRTSTLRFMYGVGAENDNDRNKAIYSGGLILAICTLLLFGTVYIANQIIKVPFPKIGFVWGLSYALGNFYLFVTRGFDKEYAYSIAYSLFFGALLVLNLYFLAYKHYGAKYILIAMTIAEFVQIFYLEIRIGLLRKFKPKYIDKKISIHMIRFSIPLAVTALGTWIMSYYASIQVTAMLGSSANGIFSMAMEFAKAVPMATAGIILAWQEIAFSRKPNLYEYKNKNYFSYSITSFFVFFTCFFIVFIPLMQLIIPYYLSDAFQSVGMILALCTAGFTFDCISQMIASIFGNNIDSRPIMISTIVGSAFLIITLPTFINLHAIYGASICVCLSFAITLFIRLLWLNIIMHYKISYLKILSSLIISIIVGYCSTISSYKVNILILIIGLSIGLPALFRIKKNIN
jgi:O-antigen/teichoic acid export membrane protein